MYWLNCENCMFTVHIAVIKFVSDKDFLLFFSHFSASFSQCFDENVFCVVFSGSSDIIIQQHASFAWMDSEINNWTDWITNRIVTGKKNVWYFIQIHILHRFGPVPSVEERKNTSNLIILKYNRKIFIENIDTRYIFQ